MVDLPTPDMPRSTTVRPGPIQASSASRPSARRADATSTGAPEATARTSPIRAGTSSHRSALLSSTTGSAPLDQASAR